MAYYLKKNEGLFLGPSAALNVVGAVKVARLIGPGKTVITVICDGGDRYRSKIYDCDWLREKQLTPRESCTDDHDLGFVKPANIVG